MVYLLFSYTEEASLLPRALLRISQVRTASSSAKSRFNPAEAFPMVPSSKAKNWGVSIAMGDTPMAQARCVV